MATDSTRTTFSLNGTWDLAFDPKDVGKQGKWFRRFPKSVSVPVPGVWEWVKPGYDGVGWFRKSFTLDALGADKIIRLRFGAVHYYCEVWLNGDYLGEHEGGALPFDFDLTGKVRPGVNQLVLRVINPPMDREVQGFRSGAPLNQGYIPVGKAGWYYNYGGIWRDVELLITDRIYVDDLYVQPYPFEKRAAVQVTIMNRGKKGLHDVACYISPRDGNRPVYSAVKSVMLRRGRNVVTLSLDFTAFRWWSPEDPFLYTATIRIGNDSAATRFGMREFTIKRGHFVLNGTRITLKGYLQQGSYPRTLIFPDSEEMARKELRLVKESGCNFIRAHLRPSCPSWLDLCDEQGILVEGEPGIGWISKSPKTERRCRAEIEGLLTRDRNHPCIIMWCLMNEAYHFRGFTMAEIRRMTARLAEAGRKLDDTRLLIDTSGGGGGGDVIGGTRVCLPHSNRRVAITDDHSYYPSPLPDASIRHCRTTGRQGLPWFISEFGAPLIPPDHKRVLNAYRPAERKRGLEDYVLHKDFYESLKEGFAKAGLRKVFGTVDRMVEENDRVRSDEMRLVAVAQRCNPTLAGTTLCQLADASGELFGATDFFREPKELYHQFSAAMQTPLPAPEIAPRVTIPGDDANLRLTLINESRAHETDGFVLEIVSAAGRVVRKLAEEKIRATTYVQTLLTSRLRIDLKPGTYALRAKLLRKGRVFRKAETAFTVLPKPACGVDVAGVHDARGMLTPALRRLGVAVEPFGNNYRNKHVPILIDLGVKRVERFFLYECARQLKKIVQTGGSVVLFSVDPVLLYEYLFPTLLRPARTMRSLGYIGEHPVFRDLPSECVADYVYADLFMEAYERGEDVLAAGGQVLAGGFSQNMWTRPADYAWGAGVYTIPIGRGRVVVCQMNVLEHQEGNRTAQTLLANLLDYAAGAIKPGHEDKLLSRCIDPIDSTALG